MAAGECVSVSSQSDSERANSARESQEIQDDPAQHEHVRAGRCHRREVRLRLLRPQYRHALSANRGIRFVARSAKSPNQSRSNSRVPLNNTALQALEAERTRQEERREFAGDAWRESGHVFTDELGQPLFPMALTNAFSRCAKKAGLPAGIRPQRPRYSGRRGYDAAHLRARDRA